jgi:hypothetical protein
MSDTMGARTRPGLDDRDLGMPQTSPVCSFCAHWDAGGGYHCAAYPAGEGNPTIPQAVWNGTQTHMAHIADPDDHGIVFELSVGTSVGMLPAELQREYLKREEERKLMPPNALDVSQGPQA